MMPKRPKERHWHEIIVDPQKCGIVYISAKAERQIGNTAEKCGRWELVNYSSYQEFFFTNPSKLKYIKI
jgi:hypothetical protein